MRCLAQLPREAPHTESTSPQTRLLRLHHITRLLIQAPCTFALSPHLPFLPHLMRVTHARPLNPRSSGFCAILGIVLVRVREFEFEYYIT